MSNMLVADIRSVLKNYFHFEHHIIKKLDEKWKNPALDVRPEPVEIEQFFKV
ncbi:MAG: hypothetical protein AB1753_08270 [Thermoproteota archaeon]